MTITLIFLASILNPWIKHLNDSPSLRNINLNLLKKSKIVIPKRNYNSMQENSISAILFATSRNNTPRSDSLCYNILERLETFSPFSCQKMPQKCQVNKRRQHKYGKLCTKLVVSRHSETLCVDLIGPYTLKIKDDTEIDFMYVTMINPARS